MNNEVVRKAAAMLPVFRKEYLRHCSVGFSTCPIKYCHGMVRNTVSLSGYSVYLNFMTSMMYSTGGFVSKMIWVDEPGNQVMQVLQYYDSDGKPTWVSTDPELTFLRCGLEAALAMQFRFGDAWVDQPIMFIGWGKINRLVHKYLTACGHRAMSDYTSKRNPADKRLFERVSVVISATNNFDLKARFRTTDFPNAKMIISFDGEWSITQDSSDMEDAPREERHISLFSDYPDQFLAYISEEIPGSQKWDKFADIEDLRLLSDVSDSEDELQFVYLHGIAVADAVVAHFFKGLPKEES